MTADKKPMTRAELEKRRMFYVFARTGELRKEAATMNRQHRRALVARMRKGGW
jgi:hypothetical protein